MSSDTIAEPTANSHHEAPDVVDRRQRLGLWIFIAGDAVILGALLFTYLYLRAGNTDGHWMSVMGWDFRGFSARQAQYLLNHVPARLVNEDPVSAGGAWGIVGAVALSALVFWYGEKLLRRPKVLISKFIPFAYVAAAVVVFAGVLQMAQIRAIPEFYWTSNDSEVFVHPAYGSTMLAFGIALIVHLVILFLLGVGVAIRSSRGSISTINWYQVRLVRIFWVWIAVSTLLATFVTQLWH